MKKVSKFEYVSSEEYEPVRRHIRSYMAEVTKIFKGEGIDFEWAFVGSANRNNWSFITREVGGNKGFDHDINIYIKRPDKDSFWKAKYVRQLFYNAINRVFLNMNMNMQKIEHLL